MTNKGCVAKSSSNDSITPSDGIACLKDYFIFNNQLNTSFIFGKEPLSRRSL